jgi:endonuclease/exonuclease/phosphatase family metal-dependent hydrolase
MNKQPQDTIIDKYRLVNPELEKYNIFLPQHYKNNHTLRIMSWNIYQCKISSFKNIENVIKKINPDIYCLQEHKLNGEVFFPNNYPFVVRTISEGMLENIIASKYPILSSTILKIEDNRNTIEALFDIGLYTISLHNIHLPVSNSNQRQTSIKKIIESNQNSVILGDFNSYRKLELCEEDLNKLSMLKKDYGYPNIFEAIDIMEEIGYTDSFCKSKANPPKNTSIFGGRVDFVYFPQLAEYEKINSYTYFNGESDHLPIISDIVKKF